MGATNPVSGTGPTALPPNSLAYVIKQIEDLRSQVQAIQQNRQPIPTPRMETLENATAMAKVQDGDAPVWSQAAGLYLPKHVVLG